MRRRLALLAVSLSLWGIGVDATGSSCVGPVLEMHPRVVRPGGSVLLTGRYWFRGCPGGGSANACIGVSEPAGVSRPIRDLEVSIRPVGDRPWRRIATGISADQAFRVFERVRVPAGVAPGRYLLTLHRAGFPAAYPKATLMVEPDRRP
jgi:hypothetical protein